MTDVTPTETIISSTTSTDDVKKWAAWDALVHLGKAYSAIQGQSGGVQDKIKTSILELAKWAAKYD